MVENSLGSIEQSKCGDSAPRFTYRCADTPIQKEPTEFDPNRCVTYVYDNEGHQIRTIKPAEPEE
jgi:hypothetical protein